MAENTDSGTKERDLDLGLDWDDIAEAYLGTLAALLTVAALLAVLYRGGRGRRRRR